MNTIVHPALNNLDQTLLKEKWQPVHAGIIEINDVGSSTLLALVRILYSCTNCAFNTLYQSHRCDQLHIPPIGKF